MKYGAGKKHDLLGIGGSRDEALDESIGALERVGKSRALRRIDREDRAGHRAFEQRLLLSMHRKKAAMRALDRIDALAQRLGDLGHDGPRESVDDSIVPKSRAARLEPCVLRPELAGSSFVGAPHLE